jgi:hypothetical protein
MYQGDCQSVPAADPHRRLLADAEPAWAGAPDIVLARCPFRHNPSLPDQGGRASPRWSPVSKSPCRPPIPTGPASPCLPAKSPSCRREERGRVPQNEPLGETSNLDHRVTDATKNHVRLPPSRSKCGCSRRPRFVVGLPLSSERASALELAPTRIEVSSRLRRRSPKQRSATRRATPGSPAPPERAFIAAPARMIAPFSRSHSASARSIRCNISSCAKCWAGCAKVNSPSQRRCIFVQWPWGEIRP